MPGGIGIATPDLNASVVGGPRHPSVTRQGFSGKIVHLSGKHRNSMAAFNKVARQLMMAGAAGLFQCCEGLMDQCNMHLDFQVFVFEHHTTESNPFRCRGAPLDQKPSRFEISDDESGRDSQRQ